jgi:hypothetical protein
VGRGHWKKNDQGHHQQLMLLPLSGRDGSWATPGQVWAAVQVQHMRTMFLPLLALALLLLVLHRQSLLPHGME